MLVTEWAIRPNLMPPERFVRPIQLLYAALSTSLGRRPCGQTLQRLQTFRIANLPTLYEIAYTGVLIALNLLKYVVGIGEKNIVKLIKIKPLIQ